MTGMYPIFKRELRVAFISPIAYVVITIFLIISGVWFYLNFATYSNYSMEAMRDPRMAASFNLTEWVFGPVLSTMSVFMLLIMPLLTMRLFSEEKKSGTIELLLTYPVTDAEAIMGKFLSSLVVFAIMLLLTGCYPLLAFWMASPELGPILSGYLGLFLMGSAFLAVGLFTSSITENQIIAAVISLGMYLVLWFVGWAGDIVEPGIGRILKEISLLEHFEPFTKGVIEIQHVSYYVLFTILFLFFTSRVLDSKKWRG